MSVELLPCPFCGSAPSRNIQPYGQPHIGFLLEIWCSNTDCETRPDVSDRRGVIMTQKDAEASLWPDLAAKWNTRHNAPIEMRLCEIGHVMPRPNQPYIFTVDPKCPKCVAAALPYQNENSSRDSRSD